MIHKCDHCGREGEWSEGWSRWGSLFTDEFGHSVVACSDECFQSIGDHEKAFVNKYGRKPSSSFYTRLN